MEGAFLGLLRHLVQDSLGPAQVLSDVGAGNIQCLLDYAHEMREQFLALLGGHLARLGLHHLVQDRQRGFVERQRRRYQLTVAVRANLGIFAGQRLIAVGT